MQKRFIETPGMLWSRLEPSTAERAKQAPCSPIWVTLPQITSSTACPLRLFLSANSLRVRADSPTAVTSCKVPSFLPFQRGVLTAS